MTRSNIAVSSTASPGLAAVDVLFDELNRRIIAGPKTLKVVDLVANLEKATNRDVSPVVEQLHAVARKYDVDNARVNGTDSHAQTMAQVGLVAVLALADQLLTDFDRADDLAAAEQDLRTAEGAQSRSLTQLQEAVTAGDVDAVVRLRTEVEVLFPQRVDQARARLFDLMVCRAELASAPSKARVSVRAEAVNRAEATRAAAQAALHKADEQLTEATTRLQIAERSASTMQASLTTLREQRDVAAAAAAVDDARRIRKLAGLPDDAPPPPAVVEEPERIQVLRRGPVTVIAGPDAEPFPSTIELPGRELLRSEKRILRDHGMPAGPIGVIGA